MKAKIKLFKNIALSIFILFVSSNVIAKTNDKDSVIVERCGYIFFYDLKWAWFIPLKDNIQIYCSIDNCVTENLDIGMPLQDPWKDFYFKNDSLKNNIHRFIQEKQPDLRDSLYYLKVIPVCIKYIPDKISNQYRHKFGQDEISTQYACVQNKEVIYRHEFFYYKLVDIKLCRGNVSDVEL